MKFKVKYTRKEYREEYLKSDEWINLRTLILEQKPNCQCCGKCATDVHHLVYRNIVDIKISDLLPVCRFCHEYIHDAIKDEYISQDPNNIVDITQKTKNILNDEEYAILRSWLSKKHHLSPEDETLVRSLHPVVMKKISGIVKKNVWYDKLCELKFTGRQIKEIQKIINLSLKRKMDGLDSVEKLNKSRIIRPAL